MNEEGVGSTGSVDTGPPVPPHVTFWSPQKFSFLITKSGEENTNYFTEVRTESNDKMFLKVFQKL